MKAPSKKYELTTDLDPLIAEVKRKWKEDLNAARIGGAWMLSVKPDKDGHVTLGKLHKCSELEKRYHGLDAIVIINRTRYALLGPSQRLALVHHEMCHLAAAEEHGEPVYDGHGDRRWRTAKHTIEDFTEVVQAHGAYKSDLATFTEAMLKRDPNLTLFNQQEQERPIGEGVSVTLSSGNQTVTLDHPIPHFPEPFEAAPNRKLVTGRGKLKAVAQ